jgi:hypothetical protein
VTGAHQVTARVAAPDGAVVTSTVSWSVATPPNALGLVTPARLRVGAPLMVSVTGLLPQERYTIRLAGRLVAQGKANDSGVVSRVVNNTSFLKPGRTVVRVNGATAQRSAGKSIVVVRR